jgi:hypothetical protein
MLMEPQNVQLYDVPSDVLKAILRSHPILALRTVCKGLKNRIENFPGISICLSENGAQNVNPNFFLLFKGNITIGCKHGWNHKTGWFKAVLDAIQLGLIVERIVSLDVNCNTIQALSSDLRSAVCKEGFGACESSKIDRLGLSLTVCSKIGLGWSMSALAALVKVVRKIELNLELSYRQNRESFIDIIQLLRLMPKRVTLARLNIR